ncbi:hypothetical protein KQI84_06740 [bacterium]|nr:hypothetical protein [bacterium]
MELIRTNQLRGQLDKLQMALAEWDRVKEDPTLLTSDEKRRATAAARQGLVELDVQENLARSNLEQLEFREEQWNKRLKKSEDELSQLTSATMGGLNPEAGEELVKLREKAAEIRSERDQAAIQIEEVRGKIQELAAHRAELEKMASNPVRDLSQTTPEAVQEYAAAQQERIGQRIADLEKIWESLEPPALKKRQEIQENLASYPAGGREQAEELVPTVQMILRQLKDWRMMSQVPNSRGSDINLLRLNAEQQNIPVNP